MSEETPVTLEDLKLPADVLELSKKLEKKFKINEAGCIEVDKTLYAETLPADLSLDQVRAVQKHHNALASAASLALAHVGTAYLKKNKSATSVELSFPVEKDRFEAIFDRERSYPGRGEGAEKIIKYGVLTPSWVTNGAVGSRGTLKKIRAYANDYAKSALAD